MAANSSNNWRHDMNEDNDSSSKVGMEVDRVRQLTASRMPGGNGGVNALTGGGGPGALELALMQQQAAQFPTHGGAYGSRISNEELLAAAAAASVGANAHLSMAFAPSHDANPKSMYPAPSSRASPMEREHLHPINPKTNILQLSMGPTMTSPYAAHLQMAQRAFQVQQNQEQLLQQQRQFILQQMGSGSMEETAGMPGLSQISNMDILQFLEQKQQQDMQAKMLAAAAAASSVSAAAPKPPPVPSAPAAAAPSSSAALTTRKESSFPLKLHSILANPEFQEYITWLPNGRSWRILKPAAFERVVIPLVFRHAKYASFMRQVNGWGFKRITGGPASGAAHNSYYHQYFIREYPQLCLQMKRVGKTPNGGKASEGTARGGDHDDTSVTSADGEE